MAGVSAAKEGEDGELCKAVATSVPHRRAKEYIKYLGEMHFPRGWGVGEEKNSKGKPSDYTELFPCQRLGEF